MPNLPILYIRMKSLFYLLLICILFTSCSTDSDSSASDYPDILNFYSNRSDQFLVDLNSSVVDGHMYRGANSASAHSGAHVNFINNSGGVVYPSSTNPTDYPAIYAVADGTISAVEPYYEVINDSSTHYRYGRFSVCIVGI